MKPIIKRIKRTDHYNIMHDSKKDVAVLMDYCNMLADRINELNAELQELRKEIGKNEMRKL